MMDQARDDDVNWPMKTGDEPAYAARFECTTSLQAVRQRGSARIFGAGRHLYLMGVLRTTAGIKRFLASSYLTNAREPDNAVMHLYNDTSRISGVVRAWDR